MTKNSIERILRRINAETNIKTLLSTIPKTIEKTTNPSLYSFLRGLKKVLTRRGKDNNEATYRLKEIKNFKSPPRTSLYQKDTR